MDTNEHLPALNDAAGPNFNTLFDNFGYPRRSAVIAITKKLGHDSEDPAALQDVHSRLKFLRKHRHHTAGARA